jgi:hypothetical protein
MTGKLTGAVGTRRELSETPPFPFLLILFIAARGSTA